MKTLTRKNLSDLGMVMLKISEREQRIYVGGGTGTYEDPYTLAEFDMMCANGTWNGGYVEGWGYTFPEVTSYGYYGGGDYDPYYDGGNGDYDPYYYGGSENYDYGSNWTNIDSVLPVDAFSGYSSDDPGGCQNRCREMLAYANVEMDGNRIHMVSNSEGRAGYVLPTASDGVYAIDGALENGNPIIVGVDYKVEDYNDGLEDHFIVIVGRTVTTDSSGNQIIQYQYYDPRTGSLDRGTSSDNILTLTADGKLTGIFPDSNHNYTVTSVRTNR